MRPRLLVLSLFVCTAMLGIAAEVAVFGPETFRRTGSRPNVYTRTFNVTTPQKRYLLRLTNDGVTSGRVSLNGRIVIDSGDLKRNPGRERDDRDWDRRDGRGRPRKHIERFVTLQKGANRLRVELRGKPGTSLTIAILGTATDTTAPTINAAISPLPNADGWNNSNVTVTFTCDDDTGIATCPAPVTLTTDGANQTVSGTAVDAAGNQATASVQVNIDRVAPAIAAALDASPGPAGWFLQPVTASFTCSDALSGVVSCPAIELLSNEGTHNLTRTVTDRAGNTASVSTGDIPIDLTAPAIAVSLSPPANAQGWNNTPVTVHFNCTDQASGVTSCPQDQLLSNDGANQQVSGDVTDAAGRTASITYAVNIDQARPEVLIQLNPSPNERGWFSAPVTAHFECADATSGVETCPADQIAGAQGIQNVSVTVTDRAGNSTTVESEPIRIDSIAPTITATIDPPPNADGWNSTPVTVRFDCGDSGAGVVSCPEDQVISDEGADQSLTGTVTDQAGNIAFAFARFHIDRTPPALAMTSPANGSTLLTTTVEATGTVSDDGSGLLSVTCNEVAATVSLGALECTLPLARGNNTISTTARDRAGNTTTVSVGVNHARVPVVTITEPQALSFFNITPTTIRGTVDDETATVTINSIPTPVINGQFNLALPIVEGPNTITATATSPEGAVGTASLVVTLDTTPPHVTITSPPADFTTTEEFISVAGVVNDIVVGTVNEQQAQIDVNGVPAQVANRTFLVPSLQLTPGPNVIRAIGRDRVGNQVTTEVTVTRRVVAAPQIRMISGNAQSGRIGAPLADPLVVALVDGDGNPIPAAPVIFKVTQNDGLVSAGAAGTPSAIATTDAQGRASAVWTLGRRAGAGGNAVEASAVGFEGQALFTATATQGSAAKIVVDTNNDQVGLVGEPLPKPFIAVVVDQGNNRLAGVPVTFNVLQGGGSFGGQSSIEVISDPDGRVAATLTLGPEEGNGNNFVQATYPGNEGFSAGFVASARTPGIPAETSISGVVLDNSNMPIPGVTVRAVLTAVLNSNNVAANAAPAVQTDAQGQFVLKPAPVGFVDLIIDGSTAGGGRYPTLDYDMVTVVGQDNTVGQPIYMLPISEVNQLCVDPSDPGRQGGTLTIPEAPGFSLTFSAGQVTFPGGSKVGCVSVTVVNGDKVPMVPGFGQQPRFVVTIQPSGAHFNPPAAITLPNVDGLAPREVTEMYSFDHDIGSFVAIGTGVVSDDGLIVRSSPGVGVLKAGWHCGGNPNATGAAANCPACQTCKTDHCEADPSQNGKELPNDKCKICENGSPKPVPVNPIGAGISYTFGPPETATKKINDALEKLEKIGVIASVSLLEIQGEVQEKECCDPASGKGKGKELSGSVTGDFGGFSVKAKIWPPGPIPTFQATIDIFGFASLEAKAQFVGGVFFNLSGKVTGQVGYKKKECSKDPADQAGCFHGKLEIGLTPSLSAEVGGSASITYDCFFCDKTTIAVAGSLIIGEFSWPISIAGVQFNDKSCSAGVTGGFFNPGSGSFKIAAKFSGSYKTNDTGSRKVEVTIEFLSCSISGEGVSC